MSMPFTTLDAVAVPLDSPNIDTDQIAPARFLRKPRAGGYGQFLFHDLRLDPQGQPIDDFILNRPSSQGVGVLVTDRNFGCGSSREQAVWCLVDYGIRCVIAPSFGDIFAGNAVKNGLLTIALPEDLVLQLGTAAESRAIFRIDLEAREVHVDGKRVASIDIGDTQRAALLNGWDDTDIVLREDGAAISAFEAQHRIAQPWLFQESDS